jgi:cellulose synthase/poly-beta-1,6-N-acetylglucosamine synthase-like glycosyltransferase
MPTHAAAILTPVFLAQQSPEGDEHDFLVGSVIDADTLRRARDEAERCGVATHEALLAAGAVSPEAYAVALARSLGVPVAGWDAAIVAPGGSAAVSGADTGATATLAGRLYRVLCAEGKAPGALRREAAALLAQGRRPAVATRRRIEAARDAAAQADRMEQAVHGLHSRRPVDSAGGAVCWPWQRIAAWLAAVPAVAGLAAMPEATIGALTGAAALPFLCVVVLRALALREVVLGACRLRRGDGPGRARRKAPADPLQDAELPVYSVLVPLFREAGVLDSLIRALDALDYPRARLEVLLILEAADIETQAAVLEAGLPPGFRTVVVPDQGPRTKPKALNYALHFARGEHVVVYDAEDRPEPDQLRRALKAFRAGPPEIGCVQARLNVYNPDKSWLTGQFTLEYTALFDAILPALARLGLPVPLGGTSNHFRRDTLLAAGGWDAFNVTEDADLGFRLARRGWRTAVLDSTTWEEAPASFGRWFRQRTRWLKGWMLTYLVHTREPWRLWAELGWRGALGFHMLMGGLVLLALLHPLLLALLAYHAASGQLFVPAESAAGAAVWVMTWVNLAAGYATSIAVGAVSVWRRGWPRLALSALLMPLCWLLVSAAAYRALWQLATDPYRWEKTEHGEEGQ